jgi:hypothetical protein
MEDTVKKKKVDTSFLRDETIIVRFLPKPSKEIRDPKHVAYGGKLEDCYDYIAPPRLRKDKLKNVLTSAEKEGLEFIMGVDLSIYGDFWRSYRKGGLFPIALGKRDKFLNLLVAEDYIIYKLLKANTNLIANSLEEVRNKGSYRYVMIKEGESVKHDESAVDNKELAYDIFAKIKKNSAVMRYVLKEFGKHTHAGQNPSFLKGEIGKLIESNTLDFIKIAGDESLKTKTLLNEAVVLGVAKRMNDLYYDLEGNFISEKGKEANLDNAAEYLKSPVGQEMRITLEARVKNAKE